MLAASAVAATMDEARRQWHRAELREQQRAMDHDVVWVRASELAHTRDNSFWRRALHLGAGGSPNMAKMYRYLNLLTDR